MRVVIFINFQNVNHFCFWIVEEKQKHFHIIGKYIVNLNVERSAKTQQTKTDNLVSSMSKLDTEKAIQIRNGEFVLGATASKLNDKNKYQLVKI